MPIRLSRYLRASGRGVRREGDKGSGGPEHPFTRGTLCPKMIHYERTVHSPLRLTTPLLRVGPKGSGTIPKSFWEEAIQQISRRWEGMIGQYGAEAILPYSYAGTMGLIQRNSGHPFFHRMGASRLERTICTPTLKIAWNMVLGNTPAPSRRSDGKRLSHPLGNQCRRHEHPFSPWR